jgi:hypothetical protein
MWFPTNIPNLMASFPSSPSSSSVGGGCSFIILIICCISSGFGGLLLTNRFLVLSHTFSTLVLLYSYHSPFSLTTSRWKRRPRVQSTCFHSIEAWMGGHLRSSSFSRMENIKPPRKNSYVPNFNLFQFVVE